MDAKDKFLKLKRAWIDAKGDPALRAKIDRETDALFDSLTETQKKEIIKVTESEFRKMHSEIADINETLDVRDLLAEVLPMVSVANLSKKYFGKSASWFYQRMNGNIVHGKPAKFTPAEMDTLSRALDDLSERFSRTSKRLLLQ